MHEFEEPSERPAVITREYLLSLLSGIVIQSLPRDLLPPMLDYLVANGVVVIDDQAYSLSRQPEALRARPEAARRALRSAVAAHAASDRHRLILLHIITVSSLGGSGCVSQSGGMGSMAGRPRRQPRPSPTIDDIKWERQDCIRALAGFGEPHATRLVDLIIKTAGGPGLTQPGAHDGPQQPAKQAPPPIDWASQRRQLLEAGDAEGAELLDDLLPRRRDDPVPGVLIGRDGEQDRQVVVRPLHDAEILDALSKRAYLRKLRAELQRAIAMDANTSAAVCVRWQALASWARRFERRTNDGREVIDFGGLAGPVNACRMCPGESGEPLPPELAWAEAFRDATRAALPLMRGTEDVAVHRLLQCLDRVLEGKAVDIADLVREVDVFVRAAAGRSEQPVTATPDLQQPGTSQPRDPLPQADDTLEFDPIEKATALLLRDKGQPRSMRSYAKQVGVNHSTLSRNSAWQRAWQAAQQATKKRADEIPGGSKDREGNLEAWTDDLCENCRQKPVLRTVPVKGDRMRLCEECARQYESRTSPRTS